MFVGVSRFVLHLPGARSLKDKRQVVRSFKDRVRSRLHVSVAEVGNADRLQVVTVGVSVVSGSTEVCHDVLGKARALASSLPEALLADARSEVISFGDDGKSLLDREFTLGGEADAPETPPGVQEES